MNIWNKSIFYGRIPFQGTRQEHEGLQVPFHIYCMSEDRFRYKDMSAFHRYKVVRYLLHNTSARWHGCASKLILIRCTGAWMPLCTCTSLASMHGHVASPGVMKKIATLRRVHRKSGQPCTLYLQPTTSFCVYMCFLTCSKNSVVSECFWCVYYLLSPMLFLCPKFIWTGYTNWPT